MIESDPSCEGSIRFRTQFTISRMSSKDVTSLTNDLEAMSLSSLGDDIFTSYEFKKTEQNAASVVLFHLNDAEAENSTS